MRFHQEDSVSDEVIFHSEGNVNTQNSLVENLKTLDSPKTMVRAEMDCAGIIRPVFLLECF